LAAADAAIAEDCASRAIAVLKKLQAGGYFGDPTHAEALRTDEDLRLLRGRDDFQQLTQTL
jgi:hypothetical protein